MGPRWRRTRGTCAPLRLHTTLRFRVDIKVQGQHYGSAVTRDEGGARLGDELGGPVKLNYWSN